MKKLLIFPIIILLFSCNEGAKTVQNKQSAIESKSNNTKFGNFDWLIGNWKRVNDSDGKETFENWKNMSSTEYSGVGYTIKNGDTISQENMSLTKSADTWSLFVKTPDEKKPVEFKIKEISDKQFVFTNDSIDFPKRIKYWMVKDTLKANISNEQMDILFEFIRISR